MSSSGTRGTRGYSHRGRWLRGHHGTAHRTRLGKESRRLAIIQEKRREPIGLRAVEAHCFRGIAASAHVGCLDDQPDVCDLERPRSDVDKPDAPVLSEAVGLLFDRQVLNDLHLDSPACLQQLARDDDGGQDGAPDSDAEGDVVLRNKLVGRGQTSRLRGAPELGNCFPHVIVRRPPVAADRGPGARLGNGAHTMP